MEFDDKWRARDLFIEFKELREVDEVIIPPKKDRKGGRYGFVRYFNVKDERVLAIKLDNAMLESRKIFSNVPHFQRNPRYEPKASSSFSGRRSFDHNRGPKKSSTQRLFDNVIRMEDKRAFAEVAKTQGNSYLPTKEDAKQQSIMVFPADEDEVLCYRKSFVGIPIEKGLAYNMKQLFHEEGIFTIRVTPMGANLCLLEDLVKG